MKIKQREKGITLVALIITIIVLIILAAVTIYVVTKNNFVGLATAGTQNYAEAQVNESTKMDDLVDKLEVTLSNIASIQTQDGGTGGGETPTTPEKPEKPQLPSGWDEKKVYKVTSADNKTVPVPIGFTPSEVAGENTVDGGFVIKFGVNEFVWVPVANTSEMFGVDKDGNLLGKLYDFGTSTSPKETPRAINWTETNGVMSWTSDTDYREPDVVTDSDNTSSYYTDAGITGITNATEFKEQLQKEFKDMKESVETYGGFYIGRYETGDLSTDEAKAVVAKGNEDIGNQNWYVQYQKSKTIAEGTGISSSMIWGCQWDAVMKWFLNYEDTKGYVTNSVGGNYSGSRKPTGYHSVKNICDMAGNVYDWTIEAFYTSGRVMRRRLLQP